MSTKEEILKRLDELHQKSLNISNHQLQKSDEEEAAKLLKELTLAMGDNSKELSEQLARFSFFVIKQYFTELITAKDYTVQVLDNVLGVLPTDKPSKLSAAVEITMKDRTKATQSKNLPKIVAVTALLAAKNKDGKKAFRSEINNTSGAIFSLDYSGLSKDKQKAIWEAVCLTYPDLSQCEYKSAINEWVKKYGSEDKPKPDSAQPKKEQKQSGKPTQNTKPQKKQPENNTQDKSSNDTSKALKEQYKAIMTALEKKLAPLTAATEVLQKEALSLEKLSADNTKLNISLHEKDELIEKQSGEIAKCQKELYLSNTKQSELEKRILTLEDEKAQLDEKLKQAYAIGSREAAMAEEKIRQKLQKEFVYLHEDWQEYEVSECNEENYESLQAIIKKVFRALKRNGISFEEDNE